ncbi:CRAL/TRIO N-terminal domain [Trinorchestia longiramus]|nr:CRAL/TRIO N-terminal domain [Trinorchestia longiramus]
MIMISDLFSEVEWPKVRYFPVRGILHTVRHFVTGSPRRATMKQLLSSPVKRLAKSELNEDEETKTEALKQMALWLDERPHIICRRDANFLLRFLRSRKYRTEEAQEQLQKYVKMREEHPKWFKNLDLQDPVIMELIDGGYYFALPERDKAGRRVFFNRTDLLKWTLRPPDSDSTLPQMFVTEISKLRLRLQPELHDPDPDITALTLTSRL